MADSIQNTPAPEKAPETDRQQEASPKEPQKRHRKGLWWKIPLRVLAIILLVVVLIPVALYIPPVQTGVKNLACSLVERSTGMKIEIGKFRLKWPVKVQLDDFRIIPAPGDTMVQAAGAIADVKLLPLLHLDVKINALDLHQARMNILSADSSMDMRISAGLLKVDEGSSMNLKSGHIILRNPYMRDGSVSLAMDVWKKQPTPTDTTATQFVITADRMKLDNFRFDMTMLPTIDSLGFRTDHLEITDALVNLDTSHISATSLTAGNGSFTYITPTAEYIATHPAPVDTISEATPPMVIRADSIALNDFSLLYAVKDATPLPGFDPSYIQLSDLSIGLHDFYNAATDITAPISRLTGRERSGLQVTSGSGTFAMDTTGMALRELKVSTPFSRLDVTAKIPNALMEMKPQAEVDVKADVSIGMPDVDAFMPSLGQYTRAVGATTPLNAVVEASGQLDDVEIPRFDAALPGILSLRASGRARDVLDMKKLVGQLTFDGELTRPGIVEKLAGPLGFDLPRLNIKGTASADHNTYKADFALRTPEGDLAAKGGVGLDSEHYNVNLTVDDLNVAAFMKDLGIGLVSANLRASGAGFNPEKKGAATDIHLQLDDIYYNRQHLRDIHADIKLHNGIYDIDLDSRNHAADLSLTGSGTIERDLYTFDLDADVRYLDLQALGLSPTASAGGLAGHLKGSASPARWNYNAALNLDRLKWRLPDAEYILPAVDLTFLADNSGTTASLSAPGTDLSFSSPRNLKTLLDSVTLATRDLPKQLKERNVDVGALMGHLPPFRLLANVSGNGLMRQLLSPSGMSIDTIYADLGKDSIINGDLAVEMLNTGSMLIDTLKLNLAQRNELLGYRLHMGNGPGELAEFAQVNLSGYVGTNRISAYLVQHNLKGEQGYRFGFTTSLADSVMSIHFTPLKGTIAYIPWEFNLDNHIDYILTTHRLDANLKASSAQSSILLKTEPINDGRGEELHLNLSDIHLQDFLKMSVSAPPLTATINSDIRLYYTGHSLEGNGNINLSDLSYEKVLIDNIDLGLRAGLEPKGDSKIEAIMKVAGQDALTAGILMGADSVAGMQPKEMDLLFNGLPLALANPFLGPDVAKLGGKLKGYCDMAMSRADGLRLNGALLLDSADIFLPIMGTHLRPAKDSVMVYDNVVTFDQYDIYAVNNNPLVINGTVDARKFTDIKLNMSAAAQNIQIVGTSAKAKSEIAGKLFMNLDSRVRGSLSLMDISATATILNNTDVTYTMQQLDQLTASSMEGVVKFVNLSDTTQVEKADSVIQPPTAMRISANLTIQPGAQATVNLNSNGSSKVELSPTGTLSYFQNYMGDMKLNGTLVTGNGMVRYNIPILGTKQFQFEPQSNVVWNGDLMNPTLNIRADDPVKANVATGGQASLVDFNVILDISGTLSAPKILFDLTTDNDLSIQNELQGMTPEQRSTTAMNLLLTGQYTGSGSKMVSSNMVTGNLYNFMTSQLNNWAANTIKGVDLSFGVNQYEQGDVNDSQTTTSYSYQVSKSLFDNRFKIVVGGNYSTNASADENFAQNLISDVSFEYMLRQTNNYSILARLFRHTGFESVLEGEITETGVGLAYRRRLNTLRSFFRFRRRRRSQAAQPTDTVSVTASPAAQEDTVVVLRKAEGRHKQEEAGSNAAE